MKLFSILFFALLVASCIADVSHLSGARSHDGYKYPVPDVPFDIDVKSSVDDEPETGYLPPDETFDDPPPNEYLPPVDVETPPTDYLPPGQHHHHQPGPEVYHGGHASESHHDHNNNNFPPPPPQIPPRSFANALPPARPFNNSPFVPNPVPVAATYVASNPGVGHIVSLPGHVNSHEFLNFGRK